MQTEENAQPKDAQQTRDQHFVSVVLDKCQNDKGMAARLRRADNPATEYQCWEILGWFGVDLEKDYERLPFVTLAAAMAKAKAERNGNLSLGRAIAMCYEDGRDSNQAKTRLRRLLACDELPEVCRILRPVLTLINSKVGQPLDYVRLLRQLRFFTYESGQKTKTQWAQEFYGQPVSTGETQEVAQ